MKNVLTYSAAFLWECPTSAKRTALHIKAIACSCPHLSINRIRPTASGHSIGSFAVNRKSHRFPLFRVPLPFVKAHQVTVRLFSQYIGDGNFLQPCRVSTVTCMRRLRPRQVPHFANYFVGWLNAIPSTWVSYTCYKKQSRLADRG